MGKDKFFRNEIKKKVETINTSEFSRGKKIFIGVALAVVIGIAGIGIGFGGWQELRNFAEGKVNLLGMRLGDTSLTQMLASESNITLASEGEVTDSVDTSNWDLSKVDIVYDTEGVAVPVPKGYVASGADGEHTVNTGFVIYEGDTEVTSDNAWSESCSRNQWVWVPVPDASRIYEVEANGKKKSKLYSYSSSNTARTSYTNGNYEPGILTSYDREQYFSRYKLQGMTRDKLLEEIQEEFEATVEAIEKYGGFYIGRYETGNLAQKEPVVQRMNTDINYQTWYTEYTRMQTMGVNENVKSSMIFGCLWDETLQWLIDSGNKTYEEIADSTTWGNYNPTTFKYTTTSGRTSVKASGSNTRVPAGSTEYTKANNIYDMAGNVYDWTLEGNGSNGRILRGGYYAYASASLLTAASRDYFGPGSSNDNCRVPCLLIYKVTCELLILFLKNWSDYFGGYFNFLYNRKMFCYYIKFHDKGCARFYFAKLEKHIF